MRCVNKTQDFTYLKVARDLFFLSNNNTCLFYFHSSCAIFIVSHSFSVVRIAFLELLAFTGAFKYKNWRASIRFEKNFPEERGMNMTVVINDAISTCNNNKIV